MSNRFGLKDAALLVVALLLVLTVGLRMVQGDREWRQVQRLERQLREAAQQTASQAQAVEARLDALKTQLAALNDRLASGAVAASSPPSGTGNQPRAADDDSWARPGVPIVRWPKPAFLSDPRTKKGFATGGEFAEIFPAQIAKLTPFIFTDVYARRISEITLDALADYDPKSLELRGTLADAWQIDPAGMWLRARIGADRRFSDGTEITAEDMRWTFHDYAMNPQVEADRTRSLLTGIARVEVVAPKVIEFVFKEPKYFNIPAALTLFVLPKAFYSQFTPTQINQATGLLMGSGPYKLADLDPAAQWTPGKDIVLVRNDQYWGPRPAIDRLRYRVVQDEMARLVAYRNGEADMIEPSAPQYQRASAEPGWSDRTQSLKWVNMRSGPQFIAWQCGPRGGVGGRLTPFSDKRVRLAMTHALDRERIIRDIYGGVGVLTHGYFNPASPASNPQLDPWPFDLDRAKALLKDAGWEDRDHDGTLENDRGEPFTFEFTRSAGGEVQERLGAYVRDQCAKIGIRCTIRIQDWSVLQNSMKSRDFDAITLGWGSSAPEADPNQLWHSSSIAGTGDNFAQWNSPRADSAIDKGRREFDFAKRMNHWHELERAIHEDQPYTWIRSTEWVRFIRRGVENAVPYPKGLEVPEFFISGPSGTGGAPAAAN